jgi:hypothetical protein
VFVEDVQLRGKKWPDVGQVLPMRIDRAAPERFEIDWDQVTDLRDRVLALCAQVAEQMRTWADHGPSGLSRLWTGQVRNPRL